jgi:hypothetical protein
MIATQYAPSTAFNNNSNMPNRSFLSKYQVHVPGAIAALTSGGVEATGLPDSYQVGDHDVVCGRGKGSYNRPGNKAFRTLLQQHVRDYLTARTKLDKSLVLSTIVEQVRRRGRFVKRGKDGRWHEIGDDVAREKVGHAIREAIAAGEKTKCAAAAQPSAADAAGNPAHAVQKEDFRAKQSDLLLAQLSIFQGLVGASGSNNDNGGSNDNEAAPPNAAFPW